jgi:hypothetical protein
VTWQLSYKREELLTLEGHMGYMSDMAVVLQEAHVPAKGKQFLSLVRQL